MADRPDSDENLKSLKDKLTEAKLDEEHEHDDHEHRRFLRAAAGDVDKAFNMFSKMLEWRHNIGADELLSHPPEVLDVYGKAIPHAHHKFDKKGRPIFIMKVGEINVDLMLKYTTNADVEVSHSWDMEHSMQRCKESSAKRGENVEDLVNILDLNNVGLYHRYALPFLGAVSKIDEDNYPHTLGNTVVINAPAIFPMLWGLVTVFLPTYVAERVIVLDSNYKDKLLEMVEAEDLPEEYGGTCNCEGGCVPKVDAEAVEKALSATEAAMNPETLDIAAGGAHTTTLEGGDGTRFDWFFRSVDYPATFSAIWQPDNEDPLAGFTTKVIHPLGQVQSQTAPVKGFFTADCPGKLLLTWDNTGAWMYSSTVKVAISAKGPRA